MGIFCTFCGQTQEAAPAVSKVTCVACGRDFLVAPPRGPGVGTATPTKKSSSSVALILLLVGGGGLFFVAFIGILAAIAIPNFIKFQSRAKQGEVRSNLRALFIAEKAYFAEHQRYSTDLGEVGVHIEAGNRYAYFLDADGPMVEQGTSVPNSGEGFTGWGVDRKRYPTAGVLTAKNLLCPNASRPGLIGTCPRCELVITAAGNIDSDPTLDVWSVSTSARTDSDGATIAAGAPHQEVDDLRE